MTRKRRNFCLPYNKPLSRFLMFGWFIVFLFLASCQKNVVCSTPSADTPQAKIPVILDTDIGDDIDDTWALAFLLECPEFDIKLINSTTGDTTFRAKIIAKILENCGRTDIPIGIGKQTPDELNKAFGRYTHHPYYQKSWVEGYDMSDYEGKVYQDGIDAMIDVIMKSDRPITILAIGPLPNLAEALKRQPLITQRSRVVGMHGSVRRGYSNSSKLAAEWNVATYVKDAQEVFSSKWPMAITPLDTCGIIRLWDDKYQKVLQSDSTAAKTIIDGYCAWVQRPDHPQDKRWNMDQSSTVLYDTVAIYLAMSTDLFVMETLGISVDDRGYTVIDENAKKIDCALEWKDLGAFEDLLVSRLTD